MPQQEMVFGDYLRVIIKHKVTVLIVTALVTLFTYMWSTKKEPVYNSTARIKIQRLETFADFFGEMFVTSGDPVENYVHELTSDRVLEPAAAILSADGHPTQAADLHDIKATRVEKTDLIDVTSQGASRELARDRCAAVINAFITEHDRMITSNAREQAQDIRKSFDNATNNLAKLDAEFRDKPRGIAWAPGEDSEMNALKTKLIESQIRLESLQQDGNYTDQYPDIVSLKKTISLIEGRIAGLSETQIRTHAATREYEQRKKVLEEMVSFLTKRIEESRIALARKSERVEVIERPSQGVELTKTGAYLTAIGLLLGAMLGIILAFVSETLDTSLRSLLEIERTFGLPVLGVIPDFTLIESQIPISPEGMWERFRYSEFVHTLTVFWRALSPLVSRRKSRHGGTRTRPSPLIVPTSPRSPATEGYRAIRTNLQLNSGEGKVGAIVITSAGPSEGKSTTLANLGYAFAQSGKKTLLVNANMRRPTICDTFGLTRDHGLSEILSGELPWRETVKDHRDLSIGAKAKENLGSVPGAENLFIITEGGRTILPSEWLSLPIFEAVVKEWEEEFDVVLIDGPPVLPVPDSVIMGSAVGRVVLIFQIGVTQRDSLLRTISLLQKSGATVCGLVLNRLHASWGASPDYFHYRGYYGRPEKAVKSQA